MFNRIFKISKNSQQSFFLFGPRGTGKTTWLKTNFNDAVYLDLLESKLNRILSAAPEKLENYIPAGFHGWVILDELQKIPNLLNEVHRLIEGCGYKFILTGSSARSLRKKGVNLLAGRALTFYFHPLTRDELGDKFFLPSSIKFGHLPMAQTVERPNRFLNSYIETYLREEIQQEGLTRNLGNFSRFLEAASFSQGQVLSIAQIAQDAQLERKTVENYFKILDDLLIGYRLPVFSKHAKRRLISHNKFFYFDVGVFRALRPKGPLDSEADIDGQALETLIFQEIRALNDYLELEYKIYFWRTAAGQEVDLVLYGPRGLIAIEIKRKASIGPGDLGGLVAFSRDYPQAKCFMFCSADKAERRGGIKIMPFGQAFDKLSEILKNGYA